MKSERTLRVNLVSLLIGLFSFSFFIFIRIGISYNLYGIFEEIAYYTFSKDSYTKTTFIGILSMFIFYIYIILNLLLVVNSVTDDSEETRLIDGNLIKTYFKVDSKVYFNWNVYLISLFPIVLISSIIVNYLKQYYKDYIDD